MIKALLSQEQRTRLSNIISSVEDHDNIAITTLADQIRLTWDL